MQYGGSVSSETLLSLKVDGYRRRALVYKNLSIDGSEGGLALFTQFATLIQFPISNAA